MNRSNSAMKEAKYNLVNIDQPLKCNQRISIRRMQIPIFKFQFRGYGSLIAISGCYHGREKRIQRTASAGQMLLAKESIKCDVKNEIKVHLLKLLWPFCVLWYQQTCILIIYFFSLECWSLAFLNCVKWSQRCVLIKNPQTLTWKKSFLI